MDRETTDEMIEYFSRCYMNAQAGGAAQKKFERYINALEGMKPVKADIRANIGGMKSGYCPSCKRLIDSQRHPHYCGECGQEVKWDD